LTPSPARIPVATYRLQLNSHFTFDRARAIVPYLHALGITDCYASPYLKAVPGSPHGYDVTNPTILNPEIGTRARYDAWIEALHAHGMGHVLDVVPNHMGIAKSANPWWLDVLENGPSSRFARVFDIDWHPVKRELADKVLIPILGDQYGAVLERQELRLAFEDGAFAVHYHDETLPIAPDTYEQVLAQGLPKWLARHPGSDADDLQSILTACRNLPARSRRDGGAIEQRAREKEVVKRRLAALAAGSPDIRALIDEAVARLNGTSGDPRSFDALDRLLNAQSYRLAYWRVASEEINYRRFFDINQLAAVRMEDPDVFDEVHALILELVGRGAVTGLRIDHVDGLYAPADYLARLQARAAAAIGATDPRAIYLVVEKILGPDEPLPDWPVHGTTGYEFAATVNALFVDGRNEAALDDLYARIVRGEARVSFDDIAYRARKLVMDETMSGDINALGHRLNQFSERNRHLRDFTLNSLVFSLKEVIASFPVYRTYVAPDRPVTPQDRRWITEAIRRARRRVPAMAGLVFDFIERMLLKETALASSEGTEERDRFVGKFQQATSPVAAKGIEDTALYLYNRLLSLNDVGSDPTRFGLAPERVHAWMAARQAQWPAALSATATHDTKRGEDVRARLNVLSEIPGAWKDAVVRWRTVNRRHKSEINGMAAPGPNEEYFIYQTLVGAWPFEDDEDTLAGFRARVLAYVTKALREAKVHTNWLTPDEAWEEAVRRFVEALLDRRRPNAFLQTFLPLQARVAELGIYNSLAQLLIKIAAPGVPDFYQGTELWDLSFADPDNRQPVDYEARQRLLAAGGDAAALLAQRTDGRVKLFVTARGLAARAASRDLYEQGAYVGLASVGTRRDCLFAFARQLDERLAIVCTPRLVASLVSDGAQPPVGRGVWTDTRLMLPPGAPRRYREVFTDAVIEVSEDQPDTLSAADVFARFPLALLVADRAH
jgi:(1->4)-alpha-D-glucan 1-alpha-D-glucosylmutase